MIRRKSDQNTLPKSRFKISGHALAKTRYLLELPPSGGAFLRERRRWWTRALSSPNSYIVSYTTTIELEHKMFKLCIEHICFILNQMDKMVLSHLFLKTVAELFIYLRVIPPPPNNSGGRLWGGKYKILNNDPFSLVLKILKTKQTSWCKVNG